MQIWALLANHQPTSGSWCPARAAVLEQFYPDNIQMKRQQLNFGKIQIKKIYEIGLQDNINEEMHDVRGR